MYSIYADDICIYTTRNVQSSAVVLEPKLTLEDNSAGSLEFTIPPSNTLAATIERMVTTITVLRDDDIIWRGRVLSEENDFNNNRKVYCEGDLSLFNDSIQQKITYSSSTVANYLENLITVHNSMVDSAKQFTMGDCTVSVTDSIDFETDYESTLTYINELLDTFGGHLVVRYESGVRYLDYLADFENVSGQVISFGKNLLDFSTSYDLSNLVTVLVPLGAKLPNSDERITVASVNGGSIFVESSSAIATYGRIVKTADWDKIDDPAVLLSTAQQFLSSGQFDTMSLEVSAVDLNYITDVDKISLLDLVRVQSPPHGLDSYFPVTKLEIPLDAPQNAKFSLNYSVSATLTDSFNSASSSIAAAVAKQMSMVSVRVKEVNRISSTSFTVTVTGGGEDTTNVFNIETDTSGNTVYHNLTNDTTITFKGW